MIFKIVDTHGNAMRFQEDPTDGPFSDSFCDSLFEALEELGNQGEGDVTVRCEPDALRASHD